MTANANGNDKGFSRRDFLRTTGGATAALSMAAGGVLLGGATAQAAEPPKKWDETVDVVVIGSGFAGLAAAIEAKKAGASVVVLEKMMVPGGNSIINGGVLAVAGSPLQAQKGIKDSPDLLIKDMLAAGLNLNQMDLITHVAEQSCDVLKWTIDELGVKYADVVVHLGGHSVPRSYSTPTRSGSAWVSKEIEMVKKLGVPLRTKVWMTKLFRAPDGRIQGIQVREGYKFPDAKSGTEKTIKAAKAVIMATGGFGNDLRYRMIQDPRLNKDVDSTNQPGATAEAMLQALSIGANLVQPSWIQLGPWASPDEKGFGLAPLYSAQVSFIYGVMVDPATGKRFVNELADRKIRSDAIIKTGKPAIGVADAVASKSCEDLLPKLMDRGVVKKFDTLDALAAAYNIPADAFKETVNNYNEYVKNGNDKEFGKYLQKDAKPIAAAPFYALRLWPKVHHTMGGLQIDPGAHVIDLFGQPIEGLYAAGEVSGGVHGACRLGSCATLECMVYGRIAGKNAAKTKV